MVFLLLLSLLFLTIIAFLLYKIQEDRVRFKAKIQVLEEFIVHINREDIIQKNQLFLNDELRYKLHTVNEVLNKEIFDLNYQLFEEVQSRK